MNVDRVATARCALFVPGNRPDRFAKAAAAGADMVVLDLEDAVAPDGKVAARGAVDSWLADGAEAAVRINAAGTAWHEDDLALVRRHGCPVMVPKAEDPALLRGIPGPVIALLETAEGIESARSVCEAPSVVRAAFGSVDLAAQLGIHADDQLALAWSRSRIVLAAAAANIAPPLDGVTVSLVDPALLAADIDYARRLGFTGKLCIHPRQLDATRVGFSPPAAELEWARRVLDAAAAGDVTVVDGRMVDKPVLDRARRLLAVEGS
ncbi:MAG: HpcH/HpaI aldolase/citrate lyase family protein [Sciscionella sp.]